MKSRRRCLRASIQPFYLVSIILSGLLLIGCLKVVGAPITIYKANSPTLYSATTDWTTTAGGATYVAPAAGESGMFDSTLAASNAAALTLGGNVTLDQLVFSATAPPVVIGASAGSVLTLATASGIDMTVAGNNLTLSCPVLLGTSQTWIVASNRTLTANGAIGDGGNGFGLTKTGAGALTLAGTNTFGGPALVNAGRLIISSAGSLASGAAVLVNTGAFLTNGGTIYGAVEVMTNGLNAGTAITTVTFTNGGTVVGNLTIDGNGGTNWLQANTGSPQNTNSAWVALLGGSATSTSGFITNNGALKLYGSTPLTLGTMVATGGVAAIDDFNTGGKTITFADGTALNFFKDEANAVSTLQVAGNGAAFINYFGYLDGAGIGYTNFFNGGNWTLNYVGQNNTGNHFVGVAWITNGAVVTIAANNNFVHGTWNAVSNGVLAFPSAVASGHVANNFGLNLSASNNGAIYFANGLTLGLASQNSAATSNNLNVAAGGAVYITNNLAFQGPFSQNKFPETNTVNLSGGKLLVTGALLVNAGTTASSNATPFQPFTPNAVFNWTGGQLSAGVITVSNGVMISIVTNALHSADYFVTNPAVIGGNFSPTALTNNAGILAPGDVGTADLTIINGSYVQTGTGVLDIDLNGTAPASGFQTANAYDVLVVTNTATLGGSLMVRTNGAFPLAANNGFTILTAAGGVSGAFTNLVANFVPVANAPGAYFQVVTTPTSVVLTNFGTPPAAPTLNVSPAPLYFPTLATGLTETVTVTLYNSGLQTLTGSVALAGSPFAILGGTNFILAGGATTNLTVSFAAATNANFAGSLVFTSNGGNVTNPISATAFLPVSSGSGYVQSGVTVVDAGTTGTFTVTSAATNFVWLLDGNLTAGRGIVGTNGPTFTYAPNWNDVGLHWLTCRQTLPGGQVTNASWAVRVRISLPPAGVYFYVATNGSDANPGTLALPFQSLEAARNAVRNLEPLPPGGVTVWLRGGTYRRTNSFVLTAADSGTPAAPVVYRSNPGETVVIKAGTPIPASAFGPLASSQTNRVPPGVNPTNILEMDPTVYGITHTGPYDVNGNGPLCELFYNDQRMYLSRYPNNNLTNADLYTQDLLMNGVVRGLVTATNLVDTNNGDSFYYLNYPGIYTNSAGVPVVVGGAFKYNDTTNDAAHVARWRSALTNGGVWVWGNWRVAWQVNGAKVLGVDTVSNVLELDPNISIQGGVGSYFNRPVGSKAEPYWVWNLLEEMDQPGEWAVDFNRNKIYFYPPGPLTNGSVVLSDFTSPVVQLNQTTNVVFQSLQFDIGLGQCFQESNCVNTLVAGCTLRNFADYVVNIVNGFSNGVVSCSISNLANNGIYLRGGKGNWTNTPAPLVPSGWPAPPVGDPVASPYPHLLSGHFVVNNLITNWSRVARANAAAITLEHGGNAQNYAVGMRVAHNLMGGSPHAALEHSGWDNVFEYNDISTFCVRYNDLGGSYGWGNLPWKGNLIWRFNFIHDSPHGNGIYNDGGDNWDHPIYGNVLNLKTVPAEPFGFGVLYNTYGSQLTPGFEQAACCLNNLALNCHTGFKNFYGTTNSIIEENAVINSTSDYVWELITPGSPSNTVSVSSAAVMASGPNTTYTNDPGFLDLTNNDLRLLPTATIYNDMPAFAPIPFELIGLYNDEFGTNARGFRPCVLNQATTGIASRSSALTALLAYPQFGSNTTVTAYWGPTDGGTNPAAWAASAMAFNQTAGAVTLTATGLPATTNWYYRFYASNAGGSYWAPASTTFTTPPDLAVFGSRMRITASGYTANETLVNFPALVKFGTNLPGFAYKQFSSPNGGDLRFLDASGANYLNYEIEQWNTNGVSYVWVQLPQLSALNNSFWAVWGNPAATNPPASTTNGATWNPDYLAVWHLNQTPTNAMQDATANNFDAACATNFPATNQVPGVVANGLLFRTNYLTVADAAALRLTNTGQFTLSAWVNLTTNNQGVILGKGKNGSKYYSWFLTVGNNPGVDNNNPTHRLCVGFRTSSNPPATQVTQTNDVPLTNWVYVAGTLDGTALSLYVNGQLNNVTNTSASPYAITDPVWLGMDANRDQLLGRLDEVRVEDLARSSNWLQASYLTVASNATFTSYATVNRTPPALSLGSPGGAGRLFFNWPSSGVGYALYTRTNLAAGSDWSLMTNTPVLVSSNGILQWQISISFGTNTASYYRLKAQ